MKTTSLIFALLIINISSCNSNKNSMSTKYFQSWSGYSIPRTPENEIDSIKATELDVYYKAFYNEDNLIVKFEKIYNGKMEWSDEYEYWPKSKKLKRHILTNSEGIKTYQEYAKNGKRIKTE